MRTGIVLSATALLLIGTGVHPDALSAQGRDTQAAAPGGGGTKPQNVQGTGTVDTVPKWTGTNTTGDSRIRDAGPNVTVAAPLRVSTSTDNGVQGSSSGSQAAGVAGFNDNDTGVLGGGGRFGVSGYATGANTGATDCCITGVIGSASSPDSRIPIGVGGYVDAANGWGTQGLNQGGGIGVLAESRGGAGQGTALQSESDGGEAGRFLVDSATGILLRGFRVNFNGPGGWDEKFRVDADGSLTIYGAATKPGGGSWSTLSDRRAKTSIEPIRAGLEHLLQLRGVTFEYAHPAAVGQLPGVQLGMVAQDVEQVFPSWVDTGADGYKRVTFRGFEALTVEAMRDLHDQLVTASHESLTRIADLERQNAELRQSLEALTGIVRSLQAK